MKIDIENTKKMVGMIFRYGVTGFSGMGVNLVVFALFVKYTDLWLVLVSILSFIAAYAVTFSLHKYWTFRNISGELFYKQSVVYFFTALGNLLVNTLFLYVFVSFGLQAVLSQFISLLIAAFLSFLFTTQVTFHANVSRIHFVTSFFESSLWKSIWRR